MDPGSLLCVDCGLVAADLFCTCSDPESCLCQQCFSKHSKKMPPKNHLTRPIGDLLGYKDPSYFDRKENYATMQGQARQGVTEVNRAIEEYKAFAEEVIQNIRSSVDKTIVELESVEARLSTEVEDALEEVGRTLAEPHPYFASKFGMAFRALVEKPAPFKLFRFIVPTCPESISSLFSLQFNQCFPEELTCKAQGNLEAALLTALSKSPIDHIPCPYQLPPSLPFYSLDSHLEHIYLAHREVANRKVFQMESLKRYLEHILQTKVPGCVLKPYGSCVNGFATAFSDFDYTIIIDEGHFIMQQVHSLMQLQGYTTVEELFYQIRTLKCTRPNSIELDLSYDNAVAVCNSKLLSTYAELDERVRALGILIKHWAKMRQIADASQGYLTSYSYIVLLIAYLQRTDPPLVPNLQANNIRGKYTYYIKGYNCTFDDNLERYAEMTKENSLGLGDLLIGFFRYYGYEFDWQNTCVTMQASNMGEIRWMTGIAIADPFEEERNLGNITKSQVIIEEFKWAAYLLSKGADFESVCSFGLR